MNCSRCREKSASELHIRFGVRNRMLARRPHTAKRRLTTKIVESVNRHGGNQECRKVSCSSLGTVCWLGSVCQQQTGPLHHTCGQSISQQHRTNHCLEARFRISISFFETINHAPLHTYIFGYFVLSSLEITTAVVGGYATPM